MSDSNLELPPLDADVEALLRVERDRASVGGAQAERMWSAITLELGAAAVSPAAEAGPVGGPASAGQSAVGSGIGKLVLLKALPWMAASLAVGSVGGFVAGHRVGPRASHVPVPTLREAADRAGSAAAPQLAPVPSPLEPPSPATTAVLSPAAPSPHVRRRQAARQDARPDDQLAEEEALLGQAESALRAGSWSTALAKIEAYDRRYPTGELAEEAAWLGVRACQRGGDAVLTRSRLLDFRRRFPSSPLGKSGGD